MSLTKSNKIETNKYELEISVDADKFNAAVDKAFRKNVGKINVPGFRKGKAPRSIVEKMYGEGVFYEDAVNMVYPEEYDAAVKEAKLEPVDRADIEVVSIGKDGFVFKAKITVKPEVEIGQYKGLEAKKIPFAVSDEDVSVELGRLQERNSRLITVEDRAAQKGDTAIIDFEGFVDGVAFKGGKGEKHPLELGSGQFIPGFEDQIVGHSTNDEFDVNVKFPDDYNVEDLKGKDATFKVKIHEIQKKELPALDDEFAKDVSEYNTLDELKAGIRKDIEEAKQHQSDENIENQLIEKIIGGMKAEIPEVMFDHSVESMISDFDYRLQSQGLNISSYLKYSGTTMEDFKKTFRPQAERQVKIRLALEKIAQLEAVEVTEEEFEKEYKKIAEHYHVDVDKIKTAFAKEDIEKDIKSNKAVDIVKNSASVTEAAAEEEKPEEKKETAEGKPEEEEKAEHKKTRKTAKKDSEEA